MRPLKPSLVTIVLLSSLILGLNHQALFASTPEELYNIGNMHFRNGEFKKAIENYQKAVNLKIENPKLYFNLANAYFRIENLGRAIQYYEKALKLAPRDAAIKSNLELAKQLTEDKIITPPKNLIEKALLKYYNFFSYRELMFITSTLFALSLIFFFFAVISSQRRTKYIYVSIAILILFLTSIFSLTLGIKISQALSKGYAIILSDEIDIKSGPGDNFTTVFTLHEGTKVRIRESRNKWFFISLPNGMNGWLPEKIESKETLGRI